MRSKKGFTLIELLAVIVILAIISIIAVPIVLNIIDTARRGSAESSANGYIDAVEYYNASLSMKGQPLMDGEYDVADLDIKLDGKKPAYGTVTIKKGQVKSADVCINGYIVEYKNKKAESHSTCNGDVDDVNPILTIDEIKKTSNKIEIKFTAKDLESGIDNTICEYGTTSNYGTKAKLNSITNGSCIIENANQDTIYYYKITTIDKNKNETVVRGNTSTESIIKPVLTSDDDWETSKVVNIEYKGTGITNPVYLMKSTVNTTSDIELTTCDSTLPKTVSECTGESTKEIIKDTWYLVPSTEVNITLNENGSIYAYTSDGINIASSNVLTITKIDTTEPEVINELLVTTKTDRAILSMECSDESGITKYEFSKDGGSTWEVSENNSYTFTKLNQTTNYNFVGRCTNGSGLKIISSKDGTTLTIQAPIWSVDTTGWSTNKTATVTFDESGMEAGLAQYYLKSTVDGTITTGTKTKVCGTETEPTSCTEETTTEVAANTWYKVSGNTSINVIVTGSMYAMTTDGKNKTISSTLTITQIDRIAPQCTNSGDAKVDDWTNAIRTIDWGCSDGLSGCAYGYSGGSTTYSFTAKTAKISAYTIKDNAGNETLCAERIANVYVDRTVPTCTNSGDSTEWTKESRTIYFGCNDDQSGCDSVYSGGSYIFEDTTKNAMIPMYYIMDKAKNQTACPPRTANVYVDKTPPTLTVNAYKTTTKEDAQNKVETELYADNTWHKGWVWVGATAKDEQTDVTLYYKRVADETLGGSGALDSSKTATAGNESVVKAYSDAQGISYYTYYACDAVGNCTDKINKTVKLDRSGPEVTTFNFKSRTTNDNLYGLYAGWSSNDKLSGVSSLTTSYPFYRSSGSEINTSFGASVATSYNTDFSSTNYLNLGSGYSDNYRAVTFKFSDAVNNTTTKKVYVFPWVNLYLHSSSSTSGLVTGDDGSNITTKSGEYTHLAARIIEYLDGNTLNVRWEIKLGNPNYATLFPTGTSQNFGFYIVIRRGSDNTLVYQKQIKSPTEINWTPKRTITGTFKYTALSTDTYYIYTYSLCPEGDICSPLDKYSNKRLGYMKITVD